MISGYYHTIEKRIDEKKWQYIISIESWTHKGAFLQYLKMQSLIGKFRLQELKACPKDASIHKQSIYKVHRLYPKHKFSRDLKQTMYYQVAPR